MAKSKEQEAYEANPKICPTCGNPIPYEKRRNATCSVACKIMPPKKTPEEKEKSKQDRKEYMRNYRQTRLNKEHKNEHNRQYYADNVDQCKAVQKVYRDAHKEQKAAYDRARYRRMRGLPPENE